MKSKVVLFARLIDPDKKYPRVPVKISRQAVAFPVKDTQGRPYPSEKVSGFYVRYLKDGKREYEPVGKDPAVAYTRYLEIEQDHARVLKGLHPVHVKADEPPEEAEDRKLRTLAATFEKNLKAQGLAKATIYAYTKAVNDLADQFPEKSIDNLIEQDLLDHVARLRETLKKRSRGDMNTTIRNRNRNLTVFFNSFQAKNPLAMRKIKKGMRKRPYRLSIALLKQLLSVATIQETDVLLYFLYTGFRDGEAAHSFYSDIDYESGSINVVEKSKYGWKPKDTDIRLENIVLKKPFVERMASRMERMGRKPDDLIFPQRTQDKPDMHLIKYVQELALRAGVPPEKQIDLHSIRRTFGSMVQKEYGIEQAMVWLGHSNIETTQAYIASEEMTTEESREKVTDMFSDFSAFDSNYDG